MTPVHEDTPPNRGGGVANYLLIFVTLLLVYHALRYIDNLPGSAEDLSTTIEELAN